MKCVNIITGVVFMCVINGLVQGSAIPMWEFLSRGEKMSHLFNMFVKQVQDYCDSLSMPDCNKVLLVYGLTNLAKMDDESLDKMDPYQRGATDMIWSSMMQGSYNNPSDSKEPLDYNQASAAGPSAGNGNNNLGSQEEASSTVEQYLTPGNNKYLIGPMVVRVMPDGSPVPGDSGKPLPKDEDAEEFEIMRAKPVPSMEEIMSGKHSSDRRHDQGLPSQRYSQSSQRYTESGERFAQSQPHAVYMAPPPEFRLPRV